jgi:hypothetical protein
MFAIRLIAGAFVATGMWALLTTVAYFIPIDEMRPLLDICKWMAVVGTFGLIAIGPVNKGNS